MIDSFSISSPQNSMRSAYSSYDGQSSTQSPRTRNLARANSIIVPLVLHVDQLAEQLVAIDLLAAPHADDHRAVVVGRAQAVNARDAGNDDHVAATDQRAGRGQPQPVDLLIDRGVFLDVDVALRNVGFGLVVVVIADEVMDGVVWEEILELAVELRRQRLVVRQHQRGLPLLLDDVGHGERLAGAGDSHQHLLLAPARNPAVSSAIAWG